MTATPAATTAAAPREEALPPFIPVLLAFVCAIVGRLQAFGAWWNQDDWGQLARAAGLIESSFPVARWLSQDLYWQLMQGLFGLADEPYTWTRLLLHGGCAALTTLIARRVGLGSAAQILAGLIVAATPFVVTPLYWASGIQELLGAVFVLAALERWLAGGTRNLVPVVLCGALSFASKENGLLLPVLLACLAWFGERRRDRAAWVAIAVLAVLAAAEAWLVLRHFAHGPGQAYALGSWSRPFANLAAYGYWLATPGPFYATRLVGATLVAGGSLWLVWTIWSAWRWRAGDRRPAACALGAVLTLAPALPLEAHHDPYLAYLTAAAGALTLSAILGRRPARPLLVLFICVATIGWSFTVTNARLKARDERGMLTDPLVLRTAVSSQAARALTARPIRTEIDTLRTIFLLQPPAAGPAAEMAERLGENWVSGTLVYNALAGVLGPRLVLEDSVQVRWVNNLKRGDLGAAVFVDAGNVLRPWGKVPQALLYLSLAEVGAGLYERAMLHLLRAGLVSEESMPFLYDPDLMLVPPARVAERADEFRAYLTTAARPGLTPERLDAVREIFEGLLRISGGAAPLGAQDGTPDGD